MRTCYEILGVSSDASDEAIRIAYKAQINKNIGDEKNISVVKKAYAILSNKELREKYDKLLEREMNEAQEKDIKVDAINVEQEKSLKEDNAKKRLPIYLSLPVILVLLYFAWPVSVVLFIWRIVKLKKGNVIDREKKIRNTKMFGYAFLVMLGVCVGLVWMAGSENDIDNEVGTEVVKANVEDELIEEIVEEEPKEIGLIDSAKATIDDFFAEEEEVSVEEQVEGMYSTYYPVLINIQSKENSLFNKNVKLNVYIDDVQITTIEQGEALNYGIILEDGYHELKVSSSIFDSEVTEFRVGDSSHMAGIPNIVITHLTYKNGDATIDELLLTNHVDFWDEYSAIGDIFIYLLVCWNHIHQ